MSITYGTAEFVAATKGATFDSHPSGENGFTLVTLTAAAQSKSGESGEFERFETLTRELVNTPKPEKS